MSEWCARARRPFASPCIKNKPCRRKCWLPFYEYEVIMHWTRRRSRIRERCYRKRAREPPYLSFACTQQQRERVRGNRCATAIYCLQFSGATTYSIRQCVFVCEREDAWVLQNANSRSAFGVCWRVFLSAKSHRLSRAFRFSAAAMGFCRNFPDGRSLF
jgi:hypothetical protein